MIRVLLRAATLWACVLGPLALIGAMRILKSPNSARAMPAIVMVDAVLVLGPLAVVLALRWIFAPRR